MSRIKRSSHRSYTRATLGLAVVVAGVTGCEGLLEVELPGQIAETSLFTPDQAAILVNSAITNVECSYSEFVGTSAAGYEDVALRITGFLPGMLEFDPRPPTANCNTSPTSFGWWTPLHYGRYLSEQSYKLISDWAPADVGTQRDQLLVQAALYAGIPYSLLGEHFCEVAVDAGELMSPDETLAVGEEWFTKALQHIGTTGDFAISNGVTSSVQQMAYLLRARTRFARGDFAGAAADALRVQRGYKAFITRDSGGERTRWNRIVELNNNEGYATVTGPITWWSGPGEWGDTIAYTGYHALGILPDGRAVTDAGLSVTLRTHPGAVADSRVSVDSVGIFNRFPKWVQRKYADLGADIPVANWEEAWLIRAEIAGGAEAIALVNEIRDEHGLPRVTYLADGDSEGIRRLIIEERRRSLFLEGRFWATKIREKLWFPRGLGVTPYPVGYLDGVRMVMPDSEFELNSNLDITQQGTLCVADQRPAV